MQNAVIHLKTKETFQKSENLQRSDRIIQAFIEACSHLDAGIFEPFMQEDDCFEDKEKYTFLTSLRNKFKQHRDRLGKNFVCSIEDTVCQGCSYGKSVKSFYFYSSDEEKSNTRGTAKLSKGFGYVLDIQNDLLIDIYECNGLILSLFNDEPSGSFFKLPDDGPSF